MWGRARYRDIGYCFYAWIFTCQPYRTKNGDQKSNRMGYFEGTFAKSLSRWRQLSAHLLSSIHSPQEPSITKVVNLLNSVLQPFIKPNNSNSQSQADNLASLVNEGRELGLLLLAQPRTWVFGWETSIVTGPNATNQIVAFPSLEEVITRGKKERRRVLCEQDRETM
ncbi:hypothetical protein OCU04_001787 [Sclerotinia nivalis]|uniref:Uncharacterized protein n=1 Tax=Sclerotinia nivalis TaxID=352851 RepID=A0A9X0AYV4_9HELO|nr:hypothetical protein OCU04_001787 [Sclerotinia nivalis]